MTEWQLNRELLDRGFVCDKASDTSLRFYCKFRDMYLTIRKKEKYPKNLVKTLVKDQWMAV